MRGRLVVDDIGAVVITKKSPQASDSFSKRNPMPETTLCRGQPESGRHQVDVAAGSRFSFQNEMPYLRRRLADDNLSQVAIR